MESALGLIELVQGTGGWPRAAISGGMLYVIYIKPDGNGGSAISDLPTSDLAPNIIWALLSSGRHVICAQAAPSRRDRHGTITSPCCFGSMASVDVCEEPSEGSHPPQSQCDCCSAKGPNTGARSLNIMANHPTRRRRNHSWPEEHPTNPRLR